MNDKKSCENCWHYGRTHVKPSEVPCPHKECEVCEKWQRDPAKWLSILPTKRGWYWWEAFKNEKEGVIYWIENYDNGAMMVSDPDGDVSVKKFGGLWQGPITPHE